MPFLSVLAIDHSVICHRSPALRTNNPPFFRELCQRHYPSLLQSGSGAAGGTPYGSGAAGGTPYGGYPASEERASVHSGRSSVDGEDDRKDK